MLCKLSHNGNQVFNILGLISKILLYMVKKCINDDLWCIICFLDLFTNISIIIRL